MRNSGRRASPRFIATAMMTLVGAGFFFVFLLEDVAGRAEVGWADVPWLLIARYIIAMGVGGALAGWLLAAMFGRRGVSGWLLALLGSALATTTAGLFGSTVGLLPDMLSDGWDMADLLPIVYGLAVLPLAFVGRPLVFVSWLVIVGVTHLWVRRARIVPSPS